MANFKIKKLPPIRLVDLLKKKKTNLKNFLSSSGIAAYQTLLQKCEKMGVSPPTEEEFKSVVGPVVSSPQEGLVVLDPPDLVKDSTGEKIAVDESFSVVPQKQDEERISEDSQKASKKNKEKSPQIDESVFVTTVSVENFEKNCVEIGDAVSVEDDLNSSISKLSTMKKSK